MVEPFTLEAVTAAPNVTVTLLPTATDLAPFVGDAAVTESVAGELQRLPDDQLARFLQVLTDLAEAEPDPQRREFLESFPHACGLAEEDA